MKKKILIGLGVLIAIFLIFVSSRPSRFNYSRSGMIQAPPEKIFPYLNDFKLGHAWSPYEKKDLNMKKTISDPSSGVGAKMEFEGNSEVGAGALEILEVVPNELVKIKLDMLKPIKGTNIIEYRLTPEAAGGTQFTWSMSGDGGFFMKLMGVFIDCEKMVAGDFTKGIENLKAVVEEAPTA